MSNFFGRGTRQPGGGKNFAGMGRISERETKRPIHDGQMRHNSRRPLTDRPTAITATPPINTSVASCASALAKYIPSRSQAQREDSSSSK